MEPNVIEEALPFEETTTPSNTEETNRHPATDEEEIDHEMLNDAMKFECVSALCE